MKTCYSPDDFVLSTATKKKLFQKTFNQNYRNNNCYNNFNPTTVDQIINIQLTNCSFKFISILFDATFKQNEKIYHLLTERATLQKIPPQHLQTQKKQLNNYKYLTLD